jgi:acyl-CoA synthetase (AMP-forming)/AMP-acid ligase II
MSQSQRHRDLVDLLESAAIATPFLPLYTFLDSRLNVIRHISCVELLDECRGRAAVFQSKFKPGDPVILFYPHGYEFIIAFFSCLIAGMVPVPLAYSRRRDYELLNELMCSTGIQALASSAELINNMPSRLDMLQLSASAPFALATDRLSGDGKWRRPELSPQHIALIQVSAGTTGVKCGTALSHANLLDNLARIQRAFAMTPGDRLLSWAPCHEGMGLITQLLLPVFAQVPSFLLDPADFAARPELWIEAISTRRCTISGGPMHAYAMTSAPGTMVLPDKIDLRSWRVAYVGSDNCSLEILRRFVDRYQQRNFIESGLFHYYGLCESGYFVCGRFGLQVMELNTIKYLSVGQPDSDIEWRIENHVHASSRRADVHSGLLTISSASTGLRWLNDSGSTRDYVHALGAAARAGASPVVSTGDIVFMKDNELFIRAQSGNVFLVDARGVFPEDIESMLMDMLGSRGLNRCVVMFLEGSKELAVAIECGRYDTAERWRGVVCLIKDMIMENFNLRTDRVLLLRPGTLPATGSGKVSRIRCREMFQEGLLMSRLLPVRGRGRMTYR